MEAAEASLAVYDGAGCESSRSEACHPARPTTAIAVMANRWKADALGRGRCGGMCAGITSSDVSCSACCDRGAEIEMTAMNRIEGAAEDSDAPDHR